MHRHWPAVGVIALGGVVGAEVRYGVDRLVPTAGGDSVGHPGSERFGLIVDGAERLDGFLPLLSELSLEGLIMIDDVQVLRYAGRSGT